jgi:hypothetical protein
MSSQEKIIFDQYQLGVTALSILRYLVVFRDAAHVSISRRLVQKYDTLGLLVSLIEVAPWTRVNPKNNRREKIHANSWIQSSEILAIPEACVWIMITSLVLNGDFESRHVPHLINLRKYITEPMVCQISNLDDLRKYLEELNIMHVMGKQPTLNNSISSFAIVDVEKTIYEILVDNGGVLAKIKPLTREEQMEAAKIIVSLYEDHASVQDEITTPFPVENSSHETCKVCGVYGAASRCSVCQKTIYCSRSCQVKDWPHHKSICN